MPEQEHHYLHRVPARKIDQIDFKKFKRFRVTSDEGSVTFIKAETNLPRPYEHAGRGCKVKGCKLVLPGGLRPEDLARAYGKHRNESHEDDIADNSIGSIQLWRRIASN